MTARPLLRLAGLATLLLAFASARSSCVDFDGQTLIVQLDAEQDQLEALIVYRDLHSTEVDPAGAIAQLETLRAGARWMAFLGNWPFMLHLESLLENPPDPETAAGRLVAALDAQLELQSGELWVDEAGRLCGGQFLRVRELGGLVTAINAAIREELATEKAQREFLDDFGITDAASSGLLGRAVASGADVFSVRGGALALEIPASPAGFIAVQRVFLKQALDAAANAVGPGAAKRDANDDLDIGLELLAGTQWGLQRGAESFTILLGDPTASDWTMEVPAEAKSKPGTLRPALHAQRWTIHGPEHEARMLADFEAFLAED